jgi:uncharacterized protein (DUF362 family)
MSKVIVARGNPYAIVPKALDYFPKPLKKVILKPNLINTEPPPTTTPYETVDAAARYYRDRGCRVIVTEGSGWCNTMDAYKSLGYLRLAKDGVELVDLNEDEYEVLRNQEALVLKEFEFPLTLKDSYLVSVAVLKEHSITNVTLSLKNMLGATIGERAIFSKKGRFHRLGIHESIVDVNLYLKPSLAIIDGRIAGFGGELRPKAKRLGLMIFSNDLVAADSIGAMHLSKDPLSIRHLRLAQEKGLGVADPKKIEIIELGEEKN